MPYATSAGTIAAYSSLNTRLQGTSTTVVEYKSVVHFYPHLPQMQAHFTKLLSGQRVLRCNGNAPNAVTTMQNGWAHSAMTTMIHMTALSSIVTALMAAV